MLPSEGGMIPVALNYLCDILALLYMFPVTTVCVCGGGSAMSLKVITGLKY